MTKGKPKLLKEYPHLLEVLRKFGRGGVFTEPVEKILARRATCEEIDFVRNWLAGMNYVYEAFNELDQAMEKRRQKYPDEYLQFKLAQHCSLWPHLPLEECFEKVEREINENA